MPESTKATLTIPAGYVDDLRSALIREIVQDADSLRVNHGTALNGGMVDDRAGALGILRRDVELLDALEALEDGGTVTAMHDNQCSPITDGLQEMARLLSERLADEMGFGPLRLGDVADITERLEWCSREAVRMAPDLGRRGEDEEGSR